MSMRITKNAAVIRGRRLLEEIRYFPQQRIKKQTCGFKFQIIYDAAIVFLRCSISHKYDSRIKVSSGFIARKSVKILKRYQKI